MRPDTVRSSTLYNASPSRHASVDLVADGILAQRYITLIIICVCEYCAMQERFAKRGKTSAQERNNRILAASGAEDQRFVDEKTMEARPVFTTSDFKYDDYKHRARQRAARHKWQLFWIPTQDTPQHVYLQECGQRVTMLIVASSTACFP